MEPVDVELQATELLLDMGVSIPVRPLRFLGRKRKPRRITMRMPHLGGLLRIGRIYLKMGVKAEQVKDYSADENLAFISEHGVEVSRMVACTIVRGWLSGLLFGNIVAWWLRWRVHPLFLSEAWYQMIAMLRLRDFNNIIRSAGMIILTKPYLSQTKKRS